MSQLVGLVLAILSIATACAVPSEIHKQMSPHQLRSVFHVESAGEVPAYEIVQLLHQHARDNGAEAAAPTLEHYRRRRRRSIDDDLNIDLAKAKAKAKAKTQAHHVKKDLSKNAYYSELKREASEQAKPNRVSGSGKHNMPADLSELDEHKVSFRAFGEHMNLTLRPTQGLFKGSPHSLRMWTLDSSPNATNGMHMDEVHDEEANSKEQIGEVFQDEANMAAILMRRHMETGDLVMEGNIGHEIVIKPLPHELSPHKDQVHHVVFKRAASSSLEHMSDFAFMEPDDLEASEKLEKLQTRQKRSVSLSEFEQKIAAELEDELETEAAAEAEADESTPGRNKRQAPYIIYPEILVIVDYDGYRLHGGDNLQVKRYFISFWNGVDLRYRLLKGPRIRISIAGIIISRGRDATPYLERNRVGRDAIDSAAALTDMGKYLFRERRLPVYDIAVAITKLDMCRRNTPYEACNRGTAGFAYVGGACVVNKRLEKVNSVAIIEDTGGFSGIIVAAHEVGHLLGAVHDGSPPPSYLGGPGAQRCRWEDGYIMSDLRHTERGFRWSPCTVQSFHHFLNGDTATCLHNEPHEDGALGRSLPGTLLSLDAQCRRDRGTYACFKDERVCAQLFCFDAQTGYCVAYRPAAEGSSCGSGMHCLDGRCTPLPANFAQQPYRLAYKNFENAPDSAEENSSEEEDDDGNDDDDDDGEGEGEEDDDDENGTGNVEVKGIEDPERANSEENIVAEQPPNPVPHLLLTVTPSPQRALSPQPPPPPPSPPQFNAFQYLAQLLANNQQSWQQLFGIHIPGTPMANAHTTRAQDTALALPGGAVVVKTSTTSSVSSSIGRVGRSDDTALTHHTQHPTQTPTPTPTPPTPPTQTTPIQQNLLQLYSSEFRKQFDYYMSLLQQNNKSSNSVKRNVNLSHSRNVQHDQRTAANTETSNNMRNSNSNSNSNSNYSASSSSVSTSTSTSTTSTSRNSSSSTTSSSSSNSNSNSANSNNSNASSGTSANNNNSKKYGYNSNDNRAYHDEINNGRIQANGAAGNADADDDDDDDNEASNETIEKQKRKSDVEIEKNLKQQHQQQQHQQHLQQTLARPTSSVSSMRNNHHSQQQQEPQQHGGGRTAAPHGQQSFFDTYFKKLQTLAQTQQPQQPQQQQQTQTQSIQAPSKSTQVELETKTKTAAFGHRQQLQPDLERFGGHFLKRTNFGSTKGSRIVANQRSMQQKQQLPALAANVVGDRSNQAIAAVSTSTSSAVSRLVAPHRTITTPIPPTVTQSTPSSSLTASSAATAAAPFSTATTQLEKQEKIRTQKLIRRQLLRTQIK